MLEKWGKRLQRELTALYLAFQDPGTPWYAKLIAVIVFVYAAIPIDLLPDHLMVLGLIDDLVLLPLAILLTIKLIPRAVMAECRAKAEAGVRIDRKLKWVSGTAVVLIWIAAFTWTLGKILQQQS